MGIGVLATCLCTGDINLVSLLIHFINMTGTFFEVIETNLCGK